METTVAKDSGFCPRCQTLYTQERKTVVCRSCLKQMRENIRLQLPLETGLVRSRKPESFLDSLGHEAPEVDTEVELDHEDSGEE